jgi:hypothetical protein
MLISELTDTDLLVLDTHVGVWARGEAEGTSQLGAAALPAIEVAARGRRLFAGKPRVCVHVPSVFRCTMGE